MASNLLGAVTKGMPVMAAMRSATFSAKPTGAVKPVPTAVPPWASSQMPWRVSSIRFIEMATFVAYH